MANTSNGTTPQTKAPNIGANETQQKPVENTGLGSDQKPKYDRGDGANVPSPIAAVAAAADVPHQQGGLPPDPNKNARDISDNVPEQSAKRTGDGKTETF